MKFGMQLHNNIPQRAFRGTPKKKLPPGGPSPPLKKLKFFIYCAILLKFETSYWAIFLLYVGVC